MRKVFFAALLLFVKPCLAQDLVIQGAIIYPSPQANPITNGLVIVKNGKIVCAGKQGTVTVPKNVPVIDGRGLYLTAGYWNSHVHFTETKWNGADTASASRLTAQLNDMVNSRGFTHVFDLAELDFQNLKTLRSRIDKGEIAGPAIRAVGVPLAFTGGRCGRLRRHWSPRGNCCVRRFILEQAHGSESRAGPRAGSAR